MCLLTQAWRAVCAAAIWAATWLRKLSESLDTYCAVYSYGRWRVVYRKDLTWVPGEKPYSTQEAAEFRAAQLNGEERWT